MRLKEAPLKHIIAVVESWCQTLFNELYQFTVAGVEIRNNLNLSIRGKRLLAR